MRVRGYAAADRKACLSVFDSNVPRFFVPPERESFAAYLDALPDPYLVLEDESGRVVGCGGYALRPGTGDAVLCWGMVRQELQRTGLGRLLLEARLERIRADPVVAAADAVTIDTSHLTRGFYERYGFRVDRVTEDGYAPGLHRCDMRLLLAPRREG